MANDLFLLAVSQQRQLEGNITSRTYGSSQAPRDGGAQRGWGSERTGTASATRMPSLQKSHVVAHEKGNTRRLGISHELSQTKEMAVSDHQLPSCTGMSPQARGLTLPPPFHTMLRRPQQAAAPGKGWGCPGPCLPHHLCLSRSSSQFQPKKTLCFFRVTCFLMILQGSVSECFPQSNPWHPSHLPIPPRMCPLASSDGAWPNCCPQRCSCCAHS